MSQMKEKMNQMKSHIGKIFMAAAFIVIVVGLTGAVLAEISGRNPAEKKSQSGTVASGAADVTGTVSDELTRTAEAAGITPVKRHGALHVSGTDLKDCHGAKFRLKGVSTHGIAWFPQYVNKDAFQTLRDNYGINTIRLAMYTNKSEGYGPDAVNKVREGVKYATELGMYVIIDWHILNDGNPNQHKSEAKKFFTKMSKKYGGQKNVIYEICNEPNGNVTWNKQIKPYAKTIVKTIRKHSKNAVIGIGTPTWSQDVDVVAQSPLKGKNLMYALHFYAGTHKEWNQEKLKTAHKKGLPVMVTEFSICDASGNGSIDYDQSDAWFDLINDKNLSYAAWNISNKAETSSLFDSSCTKTSGFTDDDLSDSGRYIKEKIERFY